MIQQGWVALGLCNANAQETDHRLTFLEEVGTATAENVRSAALCRWIRSEPADATAWLQTVLGHAIADVTDARREVYLNPGNRADLVVFLANGQRIIVEVKWASLPDLGQLRRYVHANAEGNPLPVMLLCPHYWSPPANLQQTVVAARWTSLLPFLPAVQVGGLMDLSQDLTRTVRRLRVVEEAIEASTEPGAAAAAIANPLQELHHMQAQLKAGAVRTLLAQLTDIAGIMLLCRLAAAHIAAGYGPELRIAGGANGADLTVDVPFYPQQDDPGWYELVANAGPGAPTALTCVVRFRHVPATGVTSICMGTHPLPYLEGGAKAAWIARNPQPEQQRANNLAARRQDLYAAAAVQANAQVAYWWHAVAANSFTAHFGTVQDGLDYAGQLANTVVP